MSTDPLRLSEQDLQIPALEAMSNSQDGYITTTELIEVLTAALEPNGEDLELLEGRPDTRFSQKVRNLKSHKETAGNIIFEGYAADVADGFQITPEGRAYLSRQTSP